MGMTAIFVILSNFDFIAHKSLHKNLVQYGPLASDKRLFSFSYVNDIGPRSRNDIDLQYS